MKTLFLIIGAPYGDETTFNALRLAGALTKRDYHEVRVFLMGDAVSTSHSGQKVPEGYYKLQIMLNKVAKAGTGRVAVCGTCMDARGIRLEDLMEGAHRGALDELAEWTEWADKMLVF
jgi:uncharacterized protein involved in oxidation of intracellular sulfur